MKKTKKPVNTGIERYKFPEDEARFAWLSILFDAYEIVDRGVDIAIKREKRKSMRRQACTEGCSGCCRTNTDIPVYPLELAGIYWYAIEKVKGQLRNILKTNLAAHASTPPCPFLADGRCSVYPVRPFACRQFVVFAKPCGENEDPYYSRRDDVLTPLRDFTDQAFFVMLPFYGITEEPEKKNAIKNRVLDTRVSNLQTCDWNTLAKRMDEFDLKNIQEENRVNEQRTK